MWQISSLIGLFFGAAEEVIDKATMVSGKSIDILSAAWIRNTIAFGISLVAVIVVNGALPMVLLSPPIVLLGVLYGIGALTYTIVLKQVEITASSIMTSFIPLVFLPIDLYILDANLLPRQIFGIMVLILGGVIFFYRKQMHSSLSKKELALLVSIFLFDALLIGSESYLFKDYFVSLHLSEMDFLVNMWGAMFLFLTLLMAIRAMYTGSMPILMRHVGYMKGSFFPKLADYGNSFFFLKALTIASASQVASMKSFYPVILLLIVLGTQNKLKINLAEYLDRKSFIQKAIGIVIICLGAYLAR